MKHVFIITASADGSCADCPLYDSCDNSVCEALNIDDVITNVEGVDITNPLNETIVQMTSSDYKDRFIAEFNQTYIRYTKLRDMCSKWDKNELNFTPTCPRDLYEAQLSYMYNYLCILWVRAQLEHIELTVNPEDVEAFNSIENNYL